MFLYSWFLAFFIEKVYYLFNNLTKKALVKLVTLDLAATSPFRYFLALK